MIPPWRSFCVGRWWRFTMLTCSTMARSVAGSTNRTLPRLPFSRPAMTRTVSFFRIASPLPFIAASDDLRRERDDLQELPLPELARHGPEDARPNRIVLWVQEDGGVAVEFDVRPIRTPDLLRRSHHDGAGDITLLHRPVRGRLLHRHDNRVPNL